MKSCERGLILCPERRRPFREMTVLDNLLAGAYLLQDKAETRDNLEKVYQLFPVLKGPVQSDLGHPFRRRAADAGHRPGPDVRTQAAVHRRALHRSGPHPARRGVRKDRGDPRPGHHRPAGGAGGEHGLQAWLPATTCSPRARSSPKGPASSSSKTRSSAKPTWGCRPVPLALDIRSPAAVPLRRKLEPHTVLIPAGPDAAPQSAPCRDAINLSSPHES